MNIDITTVTKGFVIHGCNSKGVMGSGVALAIKRKWYEAYIEYMLSYRDGLGSVSYTEVGPKLYVMNLITQDGYGYDGKQYVKYEAVSKACETASKIMDELDPKQELPVCYPRIGALRGGGDWNILHEIIKSSFPNRELKLYEPSTSL